MNAVGWFLAGAAWTLLAVLLLVIYGLHRLRLLDDEEKH